MSTESIEGTDQQQERHRKVMPWKVEAGEHVPVAGTYPEWYVAEQAEIVARPNRDALVRGWAKEHVDQRGIVTSPAPSLDGRDLAPAECATRRDAQRRKIETLRAAEGDWTPEWFPVSPGLAEQPSSPPGWDEAVSPPSESTNPKDLIGLTKPQVHLVPPALVLHVARAMADGAAKYGPYNWREKPVRTTVYVSAAFRHLYAFLDGEDVARDSGHSHLGHAAACLGIILDALETGNLVDDRPTAGPSADIIERFTTTKETEA